MNEIESAEFLEQHPELALPDDFFDAMEPEIFWDDLWALFDD